MYDIVCIRSDFAYAVSTVPSVHVKFKKVTLRSSEVGATLSARLGLVFQRLKIEKPRLL